MIDSGRITGAVIAVGAAAALVGALASQAAASRSASSPHIRARPNNVMVNGTAMLTGSGFPANSPVRLQECGSRTWIAAQEPCDAANAITVMSSSTGRFSTPFTVDLCPRATPPKPPVTRERCYVGEPRLTGEDTFGLLGGVKIVVTYP